MERMVGQLEGQTGTCDLLKDTINRKLPGPGIVPWSMGSHLSLALVESKKKTKKRNVALSSMSNTAYSPGLTSFDYFITIWVFRRQKEFSNRSLEMDNNHGQASPAGFSCVRCPCSLNSPAKSRAPLCPLKTSWA